MIVEKMKAPFWIARLVALGLTFVWAIVDIGLGINALLKANNLKNQFTQQIPTAIVPYIIHLFDPALQVPIAVTVSDDDISQTGALVTAVAALIALSCIVMILFHLRVRLSPLALRLQGAFLAFCAAFLFAVLVPYTVFYQTRSAIIGVTVLAIQIPENIVQTVQNVLGLQSKYSQLDFLQLIAILPWFTVIFAVITAIMLFVAASRVYTKSRYRGTPLEKVPTAKRKDVDVSPGPSV